MAAILFRHQSNRHFLRYRNRKFSFISFSEGGIQFALQLREPVTIGRVGNIEVRNGVVVDEFGWI